MPHTGQNPYSGKQIGLASLAATCRTEFDDAPERALFALHITKITPDHGHYLRVHPHVQLGNHPRAYARLIDPNGVVGPGQRTPTFLTFEHPSP